MIEVPLVESEGLETRIDSERIECSCKQAGLLPHPRTCMPCVMLVVDSVARDPSLNLVLPGQFDSKRDEATIRSANFRSSADAAGQTGI